MGAEAQVREREESEVHRQGLVIDLGVWVSGEAVVVASVSLEVGTEGWWLEVEDVLHFRCPQASQAQMLRRRGGTACWAWRGGGLGVRQAARGEDLSHGGGHSTQALVYAEEGRWSVVIEGLRLPGPRAQACH